MIAIRGRFAGVAVLMALGLVACGKRGNPLPPLRPVPAGVSDFSIERRGSAVTLQFTIPAANDDGTTPSAVSRVEIFAMSLAVDASPPAPAQLLQPANLLTTVAVRAADDKPPAAAPTDTRPAPGEVARFVYAISLTGPVASSPLIRYFAVSPAAGRRRGPLSPILRVPLTAEAAAPGGVKADYNERTITLTWPAAGAGRRFLIEETGDAGERSMRLTTSPIESAAFETPVEFGRTRCFVVRAVDQGAAVSVVGAPSPPVCVTPVDRFAPPAPTGLVAVPVDGGAELVWNPSPAPDLAGYIVLRRDDPNGTLQRLTPAPIGVTMYRDAAVKSGMTYEYAVVAIDKTANESGPSNRQSVTARRPSAR